MPPVRTGGKLLPLETVLRDELPRCSMHWCDHTASEECLLVGKGWPTGPMREPFSIKLAESSACLKCANYRQSVLRFGLPFIVLYHGLDYLVFRITTGNAGLRYPWRFAVIMSVPVMFIASTGGGSLCVRSQLGSERISSSSGQSLNAGALPPREGSSQ